MNKPSLNETGEIILAASVIAISAFYIYFLILSIYLQIPFITLVTAFCNALYVPNFNIFITKTLHGILVLKWVYHLIILTLSVIILYSLACFFVKKQLPLSVIHRLMISIILVYCVLFAFLANVGRLNIIVDETILFSHTTETEKKSIIFRRPYQFVERTIELLEKDHKAIFVTDFDYNHPLDFIYRAFFKYHFYPRVVLPVSHDHKINFDSMLIFHKRNPLSVIPNGYRVVHQSSNLKYVFAIKDD